MFHGSNILTQSLRRNLCSHYVRHIHSSILTHHHYHSPPTASPFRPPSTLLPDLNPVPPYNSSHWRNPNRPFSSTLPPPPPVPPYNSSHWRNPNRPFSSTLPPPPTPPPSTPRPASLAGVAMANVTRTNFESIFQQVERDIMTSDFVAFDMEMTGIYGKPWRRTFRADTLELRYLNICHSIRQFAVLQCGICTFKWDAERQALNARPYNFNLFPGEVISRKAPMKSFLCDTSSLQFLASNNFDFNACIYNGVPYLSMEQEASARTDLGLHSSEASNSSRGESRGDIPLRSVTDVVFSESTKRRIFEWRDEIMRMRQQDAANEGDGPRTGSDKRSKAEAPEEGETEEGEADEATSPSGASRSRHMDREEYLGKPMLKMLGMSRHQQALVRQVLRKSFPDIVPLPPGIMSHPFDVIAMALVGNKEACAEFERGMFEDIKKSKEDRVKEAVGFRRVIDVIVKSGKPLIGHNCVYDLLHLHDKFIGPLPKTPEAFASSLHGFIPLLIDTKEILRANGPIKTGLAKNGSSLGTVYKRAQHNDRLDRVPVNVDPDFARYISADGSEGEVSFKHEAGYDAYMTGVVFAQACHIAGVRAESFSSIAPVPAADHSPSPQRERQSRTPADISADVSADVRSSGDVPSPSTSTAPPPPQGLDKIRQVANVVSLGHGGDLLLSLATGRQVAHPQPFAPYGFPLARDRSNVAVAWGFDEATTEDDLRATVAAVCGRAKCEVDAIFLDRTAAMLEFLDPTQAERFWMRLMEAEDKMRNRKGGSGDESGGEQWQQVKRRQADKEKRAALEAVSKGMRAGSFTVYEHLCREDWSEGGANSLLNTMVDGTQIRLERIREKAAVASALRDMGEEARGKKRDWSPPPNNNDMNRRRKQRAFPERARGNEGKGEWGGFGRGKIAEEVSRELMDFNPRVVDEF